MFALNDKVALIIGGGSGIGLATAQRLSAAGAKVIISNRSNTKDVASRFGAEYMAADVSDELQVKVLVEGVVERFGRIDILVNSAGMIADLLEITELTSDSMRNHFNVNTMGIWATIHHAAPHMEGGSIINVASLAALLGISNYAAYSASKAAVVSLTQTAAAELAPKRIRVNCVCPGSIDTPMLRQQENADTEIALVEAASAAGRVGGPEEVAALIHFLAADDCRYVNGQAIAIDGGLAGIYSNALIEAILSGRSKSQRR
jgi:3alpha(or 20beta)-hydroxysteroid dehydrogenase